MQTTQSTLQRAIAFVAGFEDDATQVGVVELLADLRQAVTRSEADAKTLDVSKTAIQMVLQRIQRDARIAYYFDPYTTSFENLTHAHCLLWNLDLKEFRAHYGPSLRFERPKCSGSCERSN